MGVREIEEAIEAFKRGHAVIFPTDTVYGIGVAVEYAASPQLIYDAKQRDGGKPIAWLVGGVEDLLCYGRDVSADALALARRHWPGALTLVVKSSDAVPAAFAPTGTIGMRMPACSSTLELVRAVGPLAASSANRAGDPAPSLFEDLDRRLIDASAYVLKGEVVASGVASTVVDATGLSLSVLRQGNVTVAER